MANPGRLFQAMSQANVECVMRSAPSGKGRVASGEGVSTEFLRFRLFAPIYSSEEEFSTGVSHGLATPPIF
jgi:hypothetical protein